MTKVELFLTHRVPCRECGTIGICRSHSEESFELQVAYFTIFPYFICRKCKCYMIPGFILYQELQGRSVDCYSFDCDHCGRLNILKEEPDEYTLGDDCQFCRQLNLFL
jgi:RNase P subunit RPR2